MERCVDTVAHAHCAEFSGPVDAAPTAAHGLDFIVGTGSGFQPMKSRSIFGPCRSALFALLLGAGACGGEEASPPAESRPQAEAPAADEAPNEADEAPDEVAVGPEASEPEAEPEASEPAFVPPPASRQARRALRRLAAAMERRAAPETPGMREYLEPCSSSEELLAAKVRIDAADDADVPRDPADQELLFDFYDRCQVGSIIARDARGQWVAIDLDIEESGSAASVVVNVGDWEREREVFRLGGIGPGDAAQLLRRSRRGRWGTTDNRVQGAATMEFSLNAYAPLVELGGVASVEGMRIFIHTVENLDRPEYVLVAQPQGGEPVELARREAEVGPCDGGGWYCESAEEEGECDAAGLRAEDRLCVLPLGISRVAIHENEIAIQGSVNVAGHGGYPPFHWFARLPPPTP